MLYYEWKKIWVKPGTKIAMLLLAVTLAVVCWSAISEMYWVNESGEHESGLEAISKRKAAKKEWAGVLTEEVIAKVIAENARINETKEGRSMDVQESNIAYGWKQGFEDIRYMLIYSFCKFQESDYYKPDSLVPMDASAFYENRVFHLREWLADKEQEWQLTDDERAFLIERYEALPTPFPYDYADGYKQLFQYSASIVMVMALILGFVVAGIFSGEFSTKADAIFYSSYHGRDKAVAAKLGAGILFVTIVYFVTMFLYTFVIFVVLGADGAGLPIQTNRYGWKSFYLLTNFQEYLLILCGGYIGTLFCLLLTMAVSAKTKSTALAAMVPFIVIFLRSFINAGSSDLVKELVGLLPDRLLDIGNEVGYFDLYQIGGKVVGAINIIFPLYIVLSVILCPLVYRMYRTLEDS